MNKKANPVGNFIRNNTVPLMFILICAVCIPLSGFSPSYLLNEIVTRMGRNVFLIMSLLIPIMAGMGLNFGMTLGAMAAEIALIFVSDWQIWGIPGMILAMILSIPLSIALGLLCGKLLNMAKGSDLGWLWVLLLLIGILLLIVLIGLINNTVRLSIYSRRFIIHTMKLVGASWGFIRHPFLVRSMRIALIASALADLILLVGIHSMLNYDAMMHQFITTQNIIIMAVSVFVIGLFIMLLCTYLSVNHFIKLKEHQMWES